MHICAPNQRIQRFCSMVGKAPTSPLKAWVLSLEVWGMWCYILQNMFMHWHAHAMFTVHVPGRLPRQPPQAEWGSLQFLQLGGLPLKPYGKPQTLATWPFHQLPRFWLLSGSPTLEIRLHGNMRFKFDWSIERREFGNDEWSASNLRQSKSVSEPHTCQ